MQSHSVAKQKLETAQLPFLNPKSVSCSTLATKDAVERAPKTTTTISRPRRFTETTALNPAARVYPYLAPVMPGMAISNRNALFLTCRIPASSGRRQTDFPNVFCAQQERKTHHSLNRTLQSPLLHRFLNSTIFAVYKAASSNNLLKTIETQ